MADETGLNVGTITALYKIDRTQSVTQVGEIKQEAAEIRNIYGNITMKLDSSQVIAETRAMIQAGTEAKLAYAGAQQSLASYRDAQVTVANATATARQWQVLANETTAQTRVVQRQAAVDTASNTNAIMAQRLATEQMRTLGQQTVVQLQQERLATQQLATAKQQLAVDTAELRKAMLEKNIALQDQTKGANSASTAHGQLSQSLIGGIVRGLEYAIAFRALYAVLGLVGQGFHELTGSAVEWEQTLNELQNNTTLTNDKMLTLGTSVLKMGQTTSAPLNELAAGYRHATNEGFELAKSTEIVNEAMMSAVSTGASVEKTTNLLASVMHEFSAQNLSAAQTMNILHLAAAEGNLTLEQLVTSGGRAFATAASLGLSLTEVSAALSTMTREGYSAAQSTTIVSDIMLHIVNPSAQARDEILKLSKATGIDLVYDFSQAGLAAKGLHGIMLDVEKATNGDAQAMFKLIPGLRGGRGELVLTTQGAADFALILNELNDTMAGRTDPTLQAYNRTVETAAFQIGKFKNEMHELWIELSTYVLPIIKVVVEELGLLIQQLAQYFGAPIPDFSGPMGKNASSTNDATSAARGLEAQVHNDTEGFTAHSQSIIDTSRSLDDFKQQSLDAGAAIRDLTENGNALKVTLDGIKETIAQTNDTYKGLIDPIRAQIAQTNALTPEQQARKLAELGLDQQAIQVKLDAPDTTAMDKSILDLRQQIDDLGKADTTAIDTRIQAIQDKMQSLGRVATREIDQQIIDLRASLQGIGNTTEIDRKIEDLKRQIAGPAPDVSAQTSGQAALFEQQASGAITQAQFQQQYGALGRQKGQILDNYAAQQSAAKTQLQVLEEQEVVQKRTDEDAKKAITDRITMLEGQKSQIAQDNAVQKDSLQLELDGLQDQKRAITDAFNLKKAGLEHDLKQAELDKARAVLDTNTKLAAITKEQEHNKLLDDRDKIERDIVNMPRLVQIEQLTAAQKAIIDPLTAERDLQQQLVDKNNEKLASMRAQKAEADAQIAAAKEALKNPPDTGQGPGAPTGPKIGGKPPMSAEEQRFWEINVSTLPSATQNPLVIYADSIREAFERLRKWFADPQNRQSIVDSVKTLVQELTTAIQGMVIVVKFLYDLQQGDIAAAWQDAQQFGSFAIHGGPTSSKSVTGAAGTWEGVSGTGPKTQPTSSTGGLPIPTFGNAFLADPLAGPYAPLIKALGWPSISGIVDGKIKEVWDNIRIAIVQQGEAQDAPGAESAGGKIFSWLGTQFKNTFGGDSVAASSLTEFDDQQNTILGPDGRLITNINATGKAAEIWGGAGGTVGTALEGVKEKTVTSLGQGSTAQQAITSYGEALGKVFGNNGLLRGYFTTDMPTSLGQLKTLVDQHFAPTTGQEVTPMTAYETLIKSIFSQGSGTVSTLMTTDVPVIFQGLLKEVRDRFGDTGDAKTPFTTYGDFIKHLFESGGSMDAYVKAFGPVVDAAMPSDIAPLAAFIKSVGDAIRQIGTIFKIPEMMNFADVPITYSSTGKSGSNYAQGVSSSPMPGHVAWVGERGPELMHVPQGSTIIPNHMLPGHAEGLNLAAIQAFTLPGAFQPLADFLYKTEQSKMSALVAAHSSHSGAGSHGIWHRFAEIALSDYLNVLGSYAGSPIGNEDSFNTLMDVARERNMDPRIFMARMQIESGYGRDAERLLPFWNFIGMGITNRPWGFDSGVHATDGGPEYEGYSNLHNMLEDLSDWLEESGGSFAGYAQGDPSGSFGQGVYQALINAMPGVGGALAGIGGGGWMEVVNAAMGYVGKLFQDNGERWFWWCEKFVNDMDQLAGIAPHRGSTAIAHAESIDLDSVTQPPGGASIFFDRSWSYAGHTEVATGNGNESIGTTSHGVDYSNDVFAPGYLGWAPPGAANGAVVRSPTIMTVGDVRGGVPEIISPQPMMQETVSAALKEAGMGGPVTLIVEDGAVRVDNQGNVQSVDQSKFKIVNAMYARSMQPGR